MISLLLVIGILLTYQHQIFYVGATDVLPEPLSKEMEEYYLNLAMKIPRLIWKIW